MPDPFSTLAGAVSVFDVAIGSCRGLYNASLAYKEAPQEVEQLRGTIENLESVLRNLRAWIIEYQSSRFVTHYHEILPESVRACMHEINTYLRELSNLLPSADESRQVRERSRWVLHKRKIAKLQQRLEGQQKNLDLCLQTVTQRTHVKLHNELGQIERLQQKELEHSDDLRKGQNSISLQLDGIRQSVDCSITENKHLTATTDSIAKNQTQDSQKLDNILSTLTHFQLVKGCIDDDAVREPSAANKLARIIRTEIRGSIIPLIERSFQKRNASNQQMLDNLHQSIELLSANVESRLSATEEQSCGFVDQGDPAQLENQAMPSGKNSVDTYRILPETNLMKSANQNQRIKVWSFAWKLTLLIGTLSVRIITRTKKKENIEAQAYNMKEQSFSRRYQFTIIFRPSQHLLKMKGFILLYKMKQDHQSTYLELCPTVTFFNVVPIDADVFCYVQDNNVDGLKSLFTERRASPNDRDQTSGFTILTMAALNGHFEACRLLLDQGAYPEDENLIFAIVGLYTSNQLTRYPVVGIDEDYLKVIRVLLNCDLDLCQAFAALVLIPMQCDRTTYEYRVWNRLGLYGRKHRTTSKVLCSLRELGLTPNDTFDFFGVDDVTYEKVLLALCDADESLIPFTQRYAALALLCELGVDVTTRNEFGWQPLHLLFFHEISAGPAEGLIELVALLLEHGADPCGLDVEGYSVLSYAAAGGRIAVFTEALSKCNIDFIDVVEETRRRLWHFFHPVGESTAVEHSVTEAASTKGLFRRRVALRSDEGGDGIMEEFSERDPKGGSLSVIGHTESMTRDKQLIHAFLIQTLELHGFSGDEILLWKEESRLSGNWLRQVFRSIDRLVW